MDDTAEPPDTDASMAADMYEQTAPRIGARCTDTIDDTNRTVIAHMLLSIDPNQHLPGEIGAQYLLCGYNEGTLLAHRQIREHLYRAPGGGLACDWESIGSRLDSHASGLDDPLGIIGRTAREVLALCCALDHGRPIPELGAICRKLDQRNKAVAITAFALATEIIRAAGGIVPEAISFELSTALHPRGHFADDLPLMHAAAAAMGLAVPPA